MVLPQACHFSVHWQVTTSPLPVCSCPWKWARPAHQGDVLVSRHQSSPTCKITRWLEEPYTWQYLLGHTLRGLLLAFHQWQRCHSCHIGPLAPQRKDSGLSWRNWRQARREDSYLSSSEDNPNPSLESIQKESGRSPLRLKNTRS